MKSTADTIEGYLASLPEDRRIALTAIRETILQNLDRDYEEGFVWGMITYYVPHRVYPAGYHTDPKQGLPYISIGAQKHHLALYMMGLYTSSRAEDAEQSRDVKWFRAAWEKAGKKLDMGKSCVRFKRLEDVPLAVLGQAVKRIPAAEHVARYEAVRQRPPKPRAAKAPAKKAKA